MITYLRVPVADVAVARERWMAHSHVKGSYVITLPRVSNFPLFGNPPLNRTNPGTAGGKVPRYDACLYKQIARGVTAHLCTFHAAISCHFGPQSVSKELPSTTLRRLTQLKARNVPVRSPQRTSFMSPQTRPRLP